MGALLDAVPAGGADHTEHHRDLATAVEAVPSLTAGVDYPTSATVTLSSAQLLDLHNTPVTLVAAPGAGKWLNVHSVTPYHKYGTAAYTIPDDLSIAWGLGGNNIGDARDAINGRAYDYHAPVDLSVAGGTDTANDHVVAKVNGGAITDGDGTVTFVVWYTIEDVPA